MKCFIIAEAGVNHNGSDELALRLIEAAATAGADAVKFQTFRADKLAAPGARKAKYQEEKTGKGDQQSMLKSLQISEGLHRVMAERCVALSIEFMSTPFDEESLDFLVSLGIKRIKVPSGEVTNLPFLARVASKGLPIILSTGMATLDEVEEAVAEIQKSASNLHRRYAETPLTLLHCTSSYPTPANEVNLRAMTTMQQALRLPVGYSDHTDGTLVSALAVAMGAVVIEKHLTLDRSLPGPDHRASLTPELFAKLVQEIRQTEECLGSSEKGPTASELETRAVVRRSVTLSRTLAAGTVLADEHLALLRPGNGIPPKHLRDVVGLELRTDLPAGTTLTWADLK